MKPTSTERRDRLLRRGAVSAALVAGVLLVVAGSAWAALPRAGDRFRFHDHESKAKAWHVDFRIDPENRRRVETLVLYSKQCGETVARRNVPISDSGVVAADGKLADGGTWAVHAEFSSPTRLGGAMRIARPDCDTGKLFFPTESTGDGHSDHEHGGGDEHGGGEHGGGDEQGGGDEHGGGHGPKFADFESATDRQRGQAAALHRRVLENWGDVSFADAKRMRFRRAPQFRNNLSMGMFHLYRKTFEEDKRRFDAERPESLVFWRRPDGPPLLLGAMFRVAPGRRPAFAGPIPIYHSHGSGPPKSQMTHVWLVQDVQMAWANCLPTTQLNQYNPAFGLNQGSATGISGVC